MNYSLPNFSIILLITPICAHSCGPTFTATFDKSGTGGRSSIDSSPNLFSVFCKVSCFFGFTATGFVLK